MCAPTSGVSLSFFSLNARANRSHPSECPSCSRKKIIGLRVVRPPPRGSRTPTAAAEATAAYGFSALLLLFLLLSDKDSPAVMIISSHPRLPANEQHPLYIRFIREASFLLWADAICEMRPPVCVSGCERRVAIFGKGELNGWRTRRNQKLSRTRARWRKKCGTGHL
jgi:hypothetical protein